LRRFRRAAPCILLIDDDGRRIETLQYLLRCAYLVMPNGSLSEADEITRHVTNSDMAPQIVIMAKHLEREDGARLHCELEDRFAGIRWILYSRTCGILWLGKLVDSIAEDRAGSGNVDSM
jgi:DNA-binding NarL/FixJ family response regulator